MRQDERVLEEAKTARYVGTVLSNEQNIWLNPSYVNPETGVCLLKLLESKIEIILKHYAWSDLKITCLNFC